MATSSWKSFISSLVKKKTPEDLKQMLDDLPRTELIERRGETGNKLVIKAVSKGRLDMLEILLEREFHPNGPGKKNYSPLQIAICRKDIDIVCLLLKYGADPERKIENDISYCDFCKSYHKGTEHPMSILMRQHFDITWLAIYVPMLSKCNNKKLYSDILKKGSSPSSFRPELSPVIHEILDMESPDIDMIKAIQRAGGEVLKPNDEGVCPILTALFREHFLIASYLISVSSPSDLGHQSKHIKYTVVHVAVRHCYHDILKQLCQKGAPLNILSTDGTPLREATDKWLYHTCCPECVQILLEYGADPDQRDSSGTTPLHLRLQKLETCKGGNMNQVVQQLIDYGADCSVLDNGGHSYMDVLLVKFTYVCSAVSVAADTNPFNENMFNNKLKLWEDVLNITIMLFRRMAPISKRCGIFFREIIQKLLRTKYEGSSLAVKLLEKTVLNLAVMTRFYFSSDETILCAIDYIKEHITMLDLEESKQRFEHIVSILEQLSGVKRLDFMSKICVRRHFNLSNASNSDKNLVALPSTLVRYVNDNEYSSRTAFVSFKERIQRMTLEENPTENDTKDSDSFVSCKEKKRQEFEKTSKENYMNEKT